MVNNTSSSATSGCSTSSCATTATNRGASCSAGISAPAAELGVLERRWRRDGNCLSQRCRRRCASSRRERRLRHVEADGDRLYRSTCRARPRCGHRRASGSTRLPRQGRPRRRGRLLDVLLQLLSCSPRTTAWWALRTSSKPSARFWAVTATDGARSEIKRRSNSERRSHRHRRWRARPPPDPLPPGYQFDVYRIEAELPPMRKGRAYRAYDTNLHALVTVNVLAPELRTELDTARFRWAVRCAVVERQMTVFSYGEWRGAPYVVVPHEHGRDATDVGTVLDRDRR